MATAANPRTKRRFKTLTDEQILDMLRLGVVWVVGDQVFSRGRELDGEPCHRGYLHVRLHWQGGRGRIVPDGGEVHHKLGKARQFDDDLQLLTRDGHVELHRNREPGDEDEVPF